MKQFIGWNVGVAIAIAVAGCSNKRSVPGVEGQDVKVATNNLEQSGFTLGAISKTFTGTKESGIVISQSPAAQTKLEKGGKVTLIVEESVTLSSVIGMDVEAAKQVLATQGLKVAGKALRTNNEAKAGSVLEQSPIPGQRVPPGASVDVVLAVPIVKPVEVVSKSPAHEAAPASAPDETFEADPAVKDTTLQDAVETGKKIWDLFAKKGKEGKGNDKTSSSKILSAPTPIAPSAGGTVSLAGGQVTFEWSQVSGALSYTHEIQVMSGNAWGPIQSTAGLSSTSCAVNVSAPFARWRVRAVDSKHKNGATSDWVMFALDGARKGLSRTDSKPRFSGVPQVTVR